MIGGFHVKVKQAYENPYYIHCAAYQLNLIISSTAGCNKEEKFFANLNQIPTFFKVIGKKTRAVEVNVPSGCKLRWNYSSKTVSIVATKNMNCSQNLKIWSMTLTVMVSQQ